MVKCTSAILDLRTISAMATFPTSTLPSIFHYQIIRQASREVFPTTKGEAKVSKWKTKRGISWTKSRTTIQRQEGPGLDNVVKTTWTALLKKLFWNQMSASDFPA